jgi:hypothetical protein
MARKRSVRPVIPEEWRSRLATLEADFPLIPHTEAGRTFSMVRRMAAEKNAGIPIWLRSGFAISTATGNATNEMDDSEWEQFYADLSARLKQDHPTLFDQVFAAESSLEGCSATSKGKLR